jgi:hypothetical protein
MSLMIATRPIHDIVLDSITLKISGATEHRRGEINDPSSYLRGAEFESQRLLILTKVLHDSR